MKVVELPESLHQEEMIEEGEVSESTSDSEPYCSEVGNIPKGNLSKAEAKNVRGHLIRNYENKNWMTNEKIASLIYYSYRVWDIPSNYICRNYLGSLQFFKRGKDLLAINRCIK